MPFCENCGKEINTPFCPYCGTKSGIIAENKQTSVGDSMNLFGMISQMNELAKSAQKMENEGRAYLNENEMDLVKNLTDFAENMINQNDELSLKVKEDRQRTCAARKAIASGHCPECGARIGKSDDFCPECGADCLMEAYEDL